MTSEIYKVSTDECYRISWESAEAIVERARGESWFTVARARTSQHLLSVLLAGGMTEQIARELLRRVPAGWGRTEADRARLAVGRIREILWPRGNADHQCGADELGAIVVVMMEQGFGPRG